MPKKSNKRRRVEHTQTQAAKLPATPVQLPPLSLSIWRDNIIPYLPLNRTAQLFTVNKFLYSVLQSNSIWEDRFLHHFPDEFKDFHKNPESSSRSLSLGGEAGSSSSQALSTTISPPLLVKRALPDSKGSYVEVDVPADGTCLFYSIVLRVLLPALNDQASFHKLFVQLFGSNPSQEAEIDLRERLKLYDGTPSFIKHHAQALEVLVDIHFRQRLVGFMESQKEEFSHIKYNEPGRSFEVEMETMKQPKTWGGHREIEACSQLLKRCIVVYQKDGIGQLIQRAKCNEQYDHTLHLVHTTSKGLSQIENHYHYLIALQHIPAVSAQASLKEEKKCLPKEAPIQH